MTFFFPHQSYIDEKARLEEMIAALSKCGICKKPTKTNKIPSTMTCSCSSMDSGKDSGGSPPEAPKDSPLSSTSPKSDIAVRANNNISVTNLSPKPSLRLEPEFSPFDQQFIADLLSSGSLLINNNRDLCALDIKLLHDLKPDLLAEYHKFVVAILKELLKFREKHRIEDDCLIPYARDKEGNLMSFRIKFTPTLHHKFIEQLAKNQFLPVQVIHQQPGDTVTYQKGENHFHPKPKYTPSTKKEEEMQEQAVKQTPFRTQLKPKGIK